MNVDYILLHLKTAQALLSEVEQDVRSTKLGLTKVKVEDAKYFLDAFLKNISDWNESLDDKSV